MKKILFILSAFVLSLVTVAQNTSENPYWSKILPQTSISATDSIDYHKSSTGKYVKIRWSDLDLATQTQLSTKIGLTSLTAGAPLSYNNTTGVFTLPVANGSTDGYLSAANYTNFAAAYAARINTFTTTGSSGAATFSGNTLNIPTYTIGGLAGSQSANLVYRSGDAGGVPTFSGLSLNDMPLFTGYTAGATQQTVTSSDKAFTAIQKLDGNIKIVDNPTVGVKYSDNFTRASLGPNYSTVGAAATFSIVSNKLNVTGGAIPSDFTNRIEYTPYEALPYKNELKLTYTIGDVNTGGFAFGFRTGLQVWLDTRTSSASVLKLYRGGVLMNSVALSNPNALNCVSGDNITISLVVDKYIVTASAYNDRLKSTIAIQYDYTFILNDAVDIGRPSPISIFAMGGAHTASFATAIDNSPKNKALIGIGNSIMFGAGPFSVKRSYFERIENTFQNVTKIASSGISAGQYCSAASLAEITSQAVNCPYALIVCATNGLGAGNTPATEIGYVNQLIAALQAGNPSIVVYVGTELPRPAIQATIDSYNALVKSTYTNVIDFASVVQSDNLSDGVHPNDAAAKYMYSLMLSTFRGKLKLINGDNEYQSPYTVGSEYRLNSGANLTLSANITNTDVVIPVTNVAGIPPFGFASISDGVTSEIIFYGGVSGSNLTGVLRGRFATTAMTVSATPTNFKVKYITSLTSQETNVLPKSINYDNFVGYNTTGPLSANDVYYYNMVSQANPVYRIGCGSGGSLVLSKANSTTTASIMFGVGNAYSFRIMHDNQGFLQIGAFSNNIGFTINSTMSSFGIKTKDYTYRLTNAGSNVASTFLVDIEGDKTISNNWGLDATNGLVYSKGNGTNRIAIGALTPIGVDVTTPGSEFGDLGIYTKPSSGAMALRARFNSTGIVTTGVTATKLIGTGTAPTIAAGTGAGTGPTVTISGTDLAGQILVTTGTSPATSAVVATVTFNTAYASAPKAILISPGNQLASTATGSGAVWVEYSTITPTGFELKEGTTGLNGSAPYVWYYTVIQ